MENTWNPKVEHIEGRLCEKGLMQESFDSDSNELIRKLTPDGKQKCKDLLKDPQYRKAYILLARHQFQRFPLEIRKVLWKKVITQLRDIKETK